MNFLLKETGSSSMKKQAGLQSWKILLHHCTKWQWQVSLKISVVLCKPCGCLTNMFSLQSMFQPYDNINQSCTQLFFTFLLKGVKWWTNLACNITSIALIISYMYTWENIQNATEFPLCIWSWSHHCATHFQWETGLACRQVSLVPALIY